MARKPPGERGLPPNEGLQFSFNLGVGSEDVAAAAASLRATVEGARRGDDAENDRFWIEAERGRLMAGTYPEDRAIYRPGYDEFRSRVRRAAGSDAQTEEFRREMGELLERMERAEKEEVDVHGLGCEADQMLQQRKSMERERWQEWAVGDEHPFSEAWRRGARILTKDMEAALKDERRRIHIDGIDGLREAWEGAMKKLTDASVPALEREGAAGTDRDAGLLDRDRNPGDRGMSM